MKCKDCNHMGYNKYSNFFYCEMTDSKLVDETANLKCRFAEPIPERYSYKKGCLYCVYQRVVDFDRYVCNKLDKRIKNVVSDGKKCREFRLCNENVMGM